jgi:hypothetical protein
MRDVERSNIRMAESGNVGWLYDNARVAISHNHQCYPTKRLATQGVQREVAPTNEKSLVNEPVENGNK